MTTQKVTAAKLKAIRETNRRIGYGSPVQRELKINWESVSYQSASSAAVADVRTPDGKTHRLYVRRTMPKASTFHGLIDGTVVGVWGGFEMAKAGLEELFCARGSRARKTDRQAWPRRESDRINQTLLSQGAEKITELQALIARIQSALNTEETGDALVQVARNAAGAEAALARLQRDIGDES